MYMYTPIVYLLSLSPPSFSGSLALSFPCSRVMRTYSPPVFHSHYTLSHTLSRSPTSTHLSSGHCCLPSSTPSGPAIARMLFKKFSILWRRAFKNCHGQAPTKWLSVSSTQEIHSTIMWEHEQVTPFIHVLKAQTGNRTWAIKACAEKTRRHKPSAH